MRRFLTISCKEASLLSTRKEEGALSFGEYARWFMHIAMCEFCRRFYRQLRSVSKEAPHIHSEEELSVESQERMEQLIRENRL